MLQNLGLSFSIVSFINFSYLSPVDVQGCSEMDLTPYRDPEAHHFLRCRKQFIPPPPPPTLSFLAFRQTLLDLPFVYAEE